MQSQSSAATGAEPHLHRRFGLREATALNMTNMIGVGPFITIPTLMTAMGGPQALLGWLVALMIAIPDGMVWAELGAAMPGSGGTYKYLREAYGREKYGRMMAFLFIWQFVLSGPLEIASGYIGFSQYLTFLMPGITSLQAKMLNIALGLAAVFLLYRKIESIARITVTLWIGTLITTGAVILTGIRYFNPALAFDFPPNAFNFSMGYLAGMGAAARIGVYDYLGYYDVCYIGDEVKDPGKVIPRSILISVIVVAFIYIAINLSIIGVVPWRDFVPEREGAPGVVSLMMDKIYGRKAAIGFTLLVLWTAFGSVFALLLGYSRIPFAAAVDGCFFKPFAKLHPTKGFPHLSLLLIGGIAIVCSFFPLGTVIDALIITRILVQFIGQIGAVILIRKKHGTANLPFKMWLYPLPCIVAFCGWVFIFSTAKNEIIALGIGTLVLGVGAYFVWARIARHWPFKTGTAEG